MSGKRAAIRAVYAQVDAPEWAAPNLDALADVLRDLSWVANGGVTIEVPDLRDLGAADADAVRAVLARAVAETADGPHPVTLVDSSDGD